MERYNIVTIMASRTQMTINYSDVDVSCLSFTKIEENTRSKGQKISYPRYDHPNTGADSPLFIQFPWIHLNQGGIPRLGEYYTDDSQRSFIKIPLDQSIPEVHEFSKLLQDIDKKLDSQEFKNLMFDSKASKYQYQPIYRIPQEEDEDVKKDPNKKDYGPKHPYMKLKIDTTYPDNKVKSKVFTSSQDESGKRIRTKVDNIVTIDDISSHICFLSKIRPVGRPVKLWAQPANKKDPSYGITFKMIKTEVEPPVKSNSKVKEYLESDEFLDSDNESEPIKVVKSTPTKQTVKDESDEESDSEVISKPLTRSVSRPVESDGDSDNESDDGEPQTVLTKSKHVSVQQVDSGESSDEEEVKPVKKTQSKTVSRTKSRAK